MNGVVGISTRGKRLCKILWAPDPSYGDAILLFHFAFCLFGSFFMHGGHAMAWLLWLLWLLSEHATNTIAKSYLWLWGETSAFVILPPCQICGWFSMRCLQCRWLNYARESAAVVVYALLHQWRNCKLPHVRPERSSFTWCNEVFAWYRLPWQ